MSEMNLDRFSICHPGDWFLPRYIRPFVQVAASVFLGSFETFAASRPNVGNGVKGRLCADVLVIPIM